jgi:Uma2 family endonuclease
MAVEQQLYTVETFEALEPGQGKRRLELVHGELVETMPTEFHAMIAATVAMFLGLFVRQNNLGRVTVEARYRSPDDPHNARIPDVSFTRKERALPVTKKGSVPQMPDLAGEIKSPDDTYKGLRETALFYLAHGVAMVWLVYPEKRIVEIYQPEADIQILTEGDIIHGKPLLPGFTLAVAEVFRED